MAQARQPGGSSVGGQFKTTDRYDPGTEIVTLIKVDGDANNNKFYEAALLPDGSVKARWGRVGAEGQTQAKGHGRVSWETLIASKRKKGYADVALAGSVSRDGGPADRTAVKDMSIKALCGDKADPQVVALVSHLSDVNAHDIASASGGKLTVANGQVQTPLGLVTRASIAKARQHLDTVSQHVQNGQTGSYSHRRAVDQYMTLIPQNVGMSRGWASQFLVEQADVQNQSQFLDQLESSLDFAEKQRAAAGDKQDLTSLFKYKLELADASVVRQMQQEYNRTANHGHGAVASAKVKRVFKLTSDTLDPAFEAKAAKVGGVKEMWHGSRAHNVLSILSKGMMVPPGNSSNVTGRMFGDGLYFSNQSSKSANYSRGGVWSSGRDRRWFMLRCKVAMGKPYQPDGRNSGRTYNQVLHDKRSDYNSINVIAGRGGVRNHEAIVPDASQVQVQYLVEFEG